jgi:prepilin-type N-terminal cleavage/methylation domain-containing protein/prepilin-type processing-associated H-X9-DG protein
MHHVHDSIQKRYAFSLIELIIAISVILILAAILIATLGAVKQRVQISQCAANLRNVGVAVRLYSNQNGGMLPGPLRAGQAASYPATDRKQLLYWIEDFVDVMPTNETTPRAEVLICPSFLEVIDDVQGRSYELSNRAETINGEYVKPFGYPGSEADGSDDLQPVSYLKIRNPATSWMMRDLDKTTSGGYADNVYAPDDPVHGNVYNVVFMDGHVETKDVGE